MLNMFKSYCVQCPMQIFHNTHLSVVQVLHGQARGDPTQPMARVTAIGQWELEARRRHKR